MNKRYKIITTRLVTLAYLTLISTAAQAQRAPVQPPAGIWLTTDNGCKAWDTNPQVNESVKWSGSCLDGYAVGQGTETWFKDSALEETANGNFKNGRIEGQGTLTFADGGKYVGQFKNGIYDDQGILTDANGNKYEGHFKDSNLDGQGTLTNADGSKYVGQWKNGKKDGQGILTLANGYKYEGQFKDDIANGQGATSLPSGEGYVGQIIDAKYDGQGAFHFANGDRYDGQFKDNLCNGAGTMSYADGSRYVGQWKNGKRDGQGTLTYADDSRYMGQWVADRAEGQGVEAFANGNKYEGQFKAGVFDGQGTLAWAKGDTYQGMFINGARTGKGVLTFAKGGSIVGEFKDGKLFGFAVAYDEDGQESRRGIWVNNVFSRATDAPDPPAQSTPQVTDTAPAPNQVSLVDDGGVYKVPVVINDTIALNFIVDSGASDVVIPFDVIPTMMRAGELNKDDYIGMQTSVMANGSKEKSYSFRIRKLTIGNMIVENVVASTTSSKGELLLGQSFLKRFNSWHIDNENKVLILNQ